MHSRKFVWRYRRRGVKTRDRTPRYWSVKRRSLITWTIITAITSLASAARSCLARIISWLHRIRPVSTFQHTSVPGGWIGLRMDPPEAELPPVEELTPGSYLQFAPKKLAALVDG